MPIYLAWMRAHLSGRTAREGGLRPEERANHFGPLSVRQRRNGLRSVRHQMPHRATTLRSRTALRESSESGTGLVARVPSRLLRVHRDRPLDGPRGRVDLPDMQRGEEPSLTCRRRLAPGVAAGGIGVSGQHEARRHPSRRSRRSQARPRERGPSRRAATRSRACGGWRLEARGCRPDPLSVAHSIAGVGSGGRCRRAADAGPEPTVIAGPSVVDARADVSIRTAFGLDRDRALSWSRARHSCWQGVRSAAREGSGAARSVGSDRALRKNPRGWAWRCVTAARTGARRHADRDE